VAKYLVFLLILLGITSPTFAQRQTTLNPFTRKLQWVYPTLQSLDDTGSTITPDTGNILVADGSNFNSAVMSGSCTITSAGVISCAGGSGAYDDSIDPVILNTTTKDVIIAGAAQKNTSKATIDGDANQTQLTVQGHSTQTSDIAIFEESDGTDLLTMDTATVKVNQNFDAASQVQFSALNCVANTNNGKLTADSSGVITCEDDISSAGGGDPDQNLWETMTADTGSIAANSTTDTFGIAGEQNSIISTKISGDNVIINATAHNADQSLWETVTADTGSIAANTTTDTLGISGAGAGIISTEVVGDTVVITGTAHTIDTFVTNIDSHDHVGGDGAQIDHDGLDNVSTSDHHTQTTDTFVTNKDSHDHVGGDGAVLKLGFQTSGNYAASDGVDGNASTADTSVVVDSTDATSFPAMFDSATGSLPIKTDGGLLYNSSTGNLQATQHGGIIEGNMVDKIASEAITGALWTFGNASGEGIEVGSTGVRVTSDQDGLITFLGLSAGFDEDWSINLDDTENTAIHGTSTGVTLHDWGTINLATDGLDLSEGNITNVGDISLDTISPDGSVVNIGTDSFVLEEAGGADLMTSDTATVRVLQDFSVAGLVLLGDNTKTFSVESTGLDITPGGKITSQGSIIAGGSTSGLVLGGETTDVCSALGEGAIFYNSTGKFMCYCNGTDDLKMNDNSTACF